MTLYKITAEHIKDWKMEVIAVVTSMEAADAVLRLVGKDDTIHYWLTRAV